MLSDKRARKLWSAIHFAIQNEDVSRLLEGKSQVLNVEAGKQYFGETAESLQPNTRDILESQFNVFNALLWTLPNAKIGNAGREAGFMGWAHPHGKSRHQCHYSERGCFP